MNWELYEIWSRSIDGHEDLVDTTKSLKEAQDIARDTIDEHELIECVIYRETEDGDLEEIETVK
jgi:hypothetical protein